MPRPTRVVIVPGLAVRSYAKPAADALRIAGHNVALLRPPAWYGAPYDLEDCGSRLAAQIAARGEVVDVLVGLSVGCQAAGIAAAQSDLVRSLLLVSPTVDPCNRDQLTLLRAWAAPKDGDGGGGDEEPGFLASIPDWAHAGLWRIVRGWNSAIAALPLEEVIPQVRSHVTIIHSEHDRLGSAQWAAELARLAGGRFLQMNGASHSWPVGDESGFAKIIEDLTR